MDQGLHRRRQAKAVAISESANGRRQRATTLVLFAIASMGIILEALSLTENIWAASHP